MTDAYEEVESPRYRRRLEAVVGRVGRQPAPGGRLVALQSGLPLHLLDGRPVEPEWSGATLLQLRLKRGLIDIPLSLLALVGLGPLLLVVICLVRLTSRGTAIFRQTRVGLGGREFEILKFRTMRLELCDEAGLSQADGQRRAGDTDRAVPAQYQHRRAAAAVEHPLRRHGGDRAATDGTRPAGGGRRLSRGGAVLRLPAPGAARGSRAGRRPMGCAARPRTSRRRGSASTTTAPMCRMSRCCST